MLRVILSDRSPSAAINATGLLRLNDKLANSVCVVRVCLRIYVRAIRYLFTSVTMRLCIMQVATNICFPKAGYLTSTDAQNDCTFNWQSEKAHSHTRAYKYIH